MAHTVRLHPKEVPFSGFRYIKGKRFHELRYMTWKSVIVLNHFKGA